MNIVDIVILAILGLSVLVGLYRGFISSVASMGGCLLSLGLSFWLSPKLAGAIQNNPDILKTLVSYTDAATKLGDQTLAGSSVTTLTETGITEILNKVSLPAPLSTLLQNNLQNKVFGAAADVGTYVSQTIVGAILNVICFIICFLVLMLVLHFIINFLKVVFKFPVLKQLNSITVHGSNLSYQFGSVKYGAYATNLRLRKIIYFQAHHCSSSGVHPHNPVLRCRG